MKSVTYVETQKCYPCPDFTSDIIGLWTLDFGL
jgi:hypothetical protein